VPSWLIVACGVIVSGNGDHVSVGTTLDGEKNLGSGFFSLGVNC
jgi:hypothetical protein